jgi:isoquinoline 1-oxidoreductase beta subunit
LASATDPALSRRDFLRLGALAGAGLVIGFRLPRAGEARGAAAKPLAPNVWLRIAPDGTVTVLVARSEMGQGVRTALPMLVAEELEADWTRVRFEQATPEPRYGSMSTGGSRSIRSLHGPLRKAGAQAREMLVSAAALTWGVDRADCRAERGEVVHGATGRRLAYGALVERAATLEVPADPPLKDPGDWKILGTRVARLDAREKVDGSAGFGLDVRVPAMRHAAVVRCPVFDGKATGFDPAPARAVRGVTDVLQISSGVAVVADSTWAAFQGAAALTVRWDEGPLAGLDSAAIRRRFAELAAQPGAVARKEGEGAAALAHAARTLEAVYETPYLAHATMEPMNCTAHVRADACDIWVATQTATGVQQRAAQVTGLKPEVIRVHTQYLGGGFGRRSEQDFVVEALELSRAVGAPVQVVWSREDDLRHDFYRPATYHLLRAGLDEAGKPRVWTHRLVGPAILRRIAAGAIRNGIDPTSVEGAAGLPYAIPNLEVDFVEHDAGIPTGFWRSVGNSQNAYAVECFVDEVAAAAGRDPFDLRRELLAGKPRHLGVLLLAAEKAGWGKPLAAGRARGIALWESFGSFVAQVAEVSVAADGAVRVLRVVCAVDCGLCMNPAIVEAQMESGIVYGLSAALKGEITIEKGRVVQGNFHDYELLRLSECPAIEVHIVPSREPPGGIGEPGTPPITPAVVNAVFAATGRRVRTLPIRAEELKRG